MRLGGCERLTDFYRMLCGALERGRVLVCYLDGLGWYGYANGVQREAMPYTARNFLTFPMDTVQPPLTNPAMATMLTGAEPSVHGVVSRREHRTKVPTLFAQLGDRGAVIEGDSVIVQTEIRQRLHTASAGRTADQAVFEGARLALAEGKKLVFVHFHGIDDAAHSHGPYSEETLERMREIDGFVEKLAKAWAGECFLISDHGLHEVLNGDPAEAAPGGNAGALPEAGDRRRGSGTAGGDHGTDCAEDRTILFGWHCPSGRIPVRELVRLANPPEKIRQVIVTGEDGFACACGETELACGEQTALVREAFVPGSPARWRLVLEGDAYARRWCRNVAEIELE